MTKSDHSNLLARNSVLIISLLAVLCIPLIYRYVKYFTPLIACGAFLLYYAVGDGLVSRKHRTILFTVFVTTLIMFFYSVVLFNVPKEWDFTCFYLYGSVAARFGDFYSPANYHLILEEISLPVELSSNFIREVIDVGCPYPPPSIFMFLPLAKFSYETALLLWTIVQSLFGLGSVILIQRIFFKERLWDGLMLSFIFFALWIGVAFTLIYSQIIFILLLFTLLAYKYRDRASSGIFLAAAIFVKPFIVILVVFYLLVRNYKALVSFVITALALVLVTILFFGVDPFIQYVVDNPATREPQWLFSESTNQSLLAEIIRRAGHTRISTNFLYPAGSLLFVGIGAILVYHIQKRKLRPELNWAVLLATMLIIYPSGQLFYITVHLLTLFILGLQNSLKLSLLVIGLIYLMSYTGMLFLNLYLLVIISFIVFEKELSGMLNRTSINSG